MVFRVYVFLLILLNLFLNHLMLYDAVINECFPSCVFRLFIASRGLGFCFVLFFGVVGLQPLLSGRQSPENPPLIWRKASSAHLAFFVEGYSGPGYLSGMEW